MNRFPAIRTGRPLVPLPFPLPSGKTLRRLSLGLVSTSLLGSCATPLIGAPQSAVVLGDNVNVRGQASLAGEVLGQLNHGDIIEMVDGIVAVGSKSGSPSRWARIQLPPSVPVYVHASFLDGESVAATRLNIRGGPGENYAVLGSLQRGDKIHSLGKQGDWVRIRPTPETYAFVSAAYVAEHPSPAPAARSVLPKRVVAPPAVAPVAVTSTASGSGAIPSFAPNAPAKPGKATIEPASTRSEVAPVLPDPTTPAATTPSLVPPPIAVAAAPVRRATGLTQPPPVAPEQPSEELPTEHISPHVPQPGTLPPHPSPAASVDSPNPIPPALILARANPADPANPQPVPVSKPEAPSIAPDPASDLVGRLDPIIDPPRRNHISVGYRFGLNGSVAFKGFATTPQPPSGVFDDGYVLDSSRQTAGPNPAPDGRTWNWGYDSPTQLQGDTLLLSHSYPQADTASHKYDDLVSGFELAYSLELYRGGRDDSFRIGFEAAFNYSSLDVKNTWTHSTDIVRDTTTFALGGVLPPYDPLTGQTYQGSYAGPGPTIPLSGTTSQITAPNGGPMTSYRELAANTYGFRLGPYLERSLYKQLWGTLGTGLAIGMVDSDLRYADTVESLPLSGSASDISTLVGFYFQGGLSYKVNASWSLFYNAQYQWLPDYTLKAGVTEARFKAGNGIFQSIGIRYSF